MADEIRIALQGHHEQMEQDTNIGWFRTFSGSDGCVSVKAVDAEGEKYFFEVDHLGKIGKSTEASYSWVGHSSWQRIRVIGQSGKRWYDDPNPKTLLTSDKTSVYGNCPLIRLQWDLGDYVRQMNSLSSSHAQHRSFFDYSVKYGRNLLVEARSSDPATSKVWDDCGIPQDV